jgi:hypothetical protein
MKARVTKDEAIRRLDAAGHANAAEQLRQWRNERGNNWGWDGMVRGKFPDLVPTIFGT